MSPFHSGMNHWQRQWLSDRLHKKHQPAEASVSIIASSKRFEIYWYQRSALVKNAFLYNCRDQDLEVRPGARIEKGEIIIGAVGLVAAQENVPGYFGKVILFEPTRQCEWQGLKLFCMVHPNVPAKAMTKSALRAFNYAVAELPQSASELAKNLDVPVLLCADGRLLINVELASFERQGKKNPRRAKLLSAEWAE